jgi:hypothetical protein
MLQMRHRPVELLFDPVDRKCKVAALKSWLHEQLVPPAPALHKIRLRTFMGSVRYATCLATHPPPPPACTIALADDRAITLQTNPPLRWQTNPPLRW